MKTMQGACEEQGENLRKFGTCLPKPKPIVNTECCLKPSKKSQKLSKRPFRRPNGGKQTDI
ncbi:hypothetical protein U722_09975 [Bacillus amyloliquefaciens LFB112]|nr:hypothetical protein U722_09975 [Bacillus amyloliquefaciens LFB112]